MDTPEGNTYDAPEDDLFLQIRWHLFNVRELQRMRVEEIGEHNLMADDRYLTDFSLPWKGAPDVDAPKWLIEEWHREREQQKATATSTTIGGGPTRVTSTDTSNIIQIWGSEGAITVQRGDLPELIQVLQGLVAGPIAPGASGSSDVSQRSAPPAHLSAVEKARWQRNQDALDYAVKAERTRQDAIIRQQQVELQQRRNRW